MKLFFIDSNLSHLADKRTAMLKKTRDALLKMDAVVETASPDEADALVIQENSSYKDFRYIQALLQDPLVSRYSYKTYTINRDDCATGLLRGLYTSIPTNRFDSSFHASVPYMEYPNELVFARRDKTVVPSRLAGWRGNTKSNRVRLKILKYLQHLPDYQLEATDSWLNHSAEEKEIYAQLILNTKFSLCPAGWAPVSFRIYESMALGRCPVIIADHFVPPRGPNWDKIALFYPEKGIGKLHSFLLSSEDLYRGMGQRAQLAWEEFFSPEVIAEYYAKSLVSLIRSAPKSCNQSELRRWTSISLYWENSWTVPQRIFRKVRKITGL